ncbi:TetR/AcrR family transcriptional regulator [Bacillus sp. 1P06AnD]|uniref:TetR/AcrR family transcriptional regulator n=1 Tax=Bacillus sp. 1P06AnD TaxID=3132208 RepID=UPI0039A01F25
MKMRGRKKGSNGEESRSHLLSAAIDLFSQHGYHDTKISDIVSKADVSQPTFYLYFKNKEALFEELIEQFRRELFELVACSKMERKHARQQVSKDIAEGLVSIFRYFRNQPELTRIGFYLSPKSEDIKKQLARMIEAKWLPKQKQGCFRSGIDMGIAAETLVGVIDRLTLTQLFEKGENPQMIAERMVSIILEGLFHGK